MNMKSGKTVSLKRDINHRHIRGTLKGLRWIVEERRLLVVAFVVELCSKEINCFSVLQTAFKPS